MSLKKLGVALLAVFVMGAIVANSAYSRNEYVDRQSSFLPKRNPD